MQPTLYTPRLILRPLTLADAPRVQHLASDARVANMTSAIPHPYPEGAAAQFIASLLRNALDEKQFVFAITLAGTRTPGREADPADTGHLIGVVSIEHDDDPATAVLGYWIGTPWWNKGFATEAANAVINFAFTRRRYQRVLANHYAHNPASGRVMEKLSLTFLGDAPQYFPVRGETFNVLHYSLAHDAWSRKKIVHRWKPQTPTLHIAGVT